MCLGIPAKLLERYEEQGMQMGKVDFGGVIKEICLEYVPEIEVGEYAIIHVGFAISRIDEEEAQKTFEMLREMEMLADELPELAEQLDENEGK